VRIITLIGICVVIFSGVTFGLEVDEEELTEQVDEEITFINYEGPHETIDSRDEIIGIGVYLGSTDEREFFTRSFANKYTIIHAVDPTVEELLDADIFIIGESALVDHVQSLRWMLEGYLSTYYVYNEEDAALLAEFITYYNAVFRKDMEYIGSNYKQIVFDNLDAEKIGISRSYKQWPGQTMMVIPLTEEAEEGGLGALDSDALSEDRVIEDLREQEDRGVEQRQDLVELKEREIEEEKQEIEEEKQQIEEEQQELEKRKQDLEERKEELEEKKQTIEEQPEEQPEEEAVQPTPEDELPSEEQQKQVTGPEPVTEEETEEQQPEEQDIEVVRAEIEREEEEIAEEEEQLEQRREEVEEREEEQEEREERVREEREQIAADQRELIAEEEGRDVEEEQPAVQPEPEATVPFIIFRETTEGVVGRFVLAGARSGEIKTDSGIETVTSRSIQEVEEGYLTIAERDNEVRILLLDNETLQINRFSEDIVYHNGQLLIEGDALYAPLRENGNWYLGRFNRQLRTTDRSEVAIAPFTLIFRVDNVLYVQDEDGSIVGLDSGNLEEIE
jgi:hypothetical protein